MNHDDNERDGKDYDRSKGGDYSGTNIDVQAYGTIDVDSLRSVLTPLQTTLIDWKIF